MKASEGQISQLRRPTTMSRASPPPSRPQSPDTLYDAVLTARYSVHLGRGFLPTRDQVTSLLRIVDKLELPPSTTTAGKGAETPISEEFEDSFGPHAGSGAQVFGPPTKVVLGLSTASDLSLCLSSLAFSCLHISRHSPLKKTASKNLLKRQRRYYLGLGAGWLVLWWLGLKWIQTSSVRSFPWTLWNGDPRTLLGGDDADWWKVLVSRVATVVPIFALHGALKRFAGRALPFLRYRAEEASGELFFVRVDS